MQNKRFTRRAFMRSLGIVGLGAALTPAPVAAAVRMTDSRKLSDNRFEVCETRFLMGTFVAITALHESRDAAKEATARAFGEIERLSAIFDRHKGDTPVSVLNATGRLSDVAPELRSVMEKAVIFNRRSGGAFDSTVLPLVEMLKGHADADGRIDLSEKDMKDALGLVDTEAVRISDNGIRFDKQGMGVTLDGIGKGYIVDRASDVLAANGVVDHLVNAGGDIRARGERAPGKAWKIAIEDPAGKGGYPSVIHLRDAAVATSGGYEVYYDANRTHHHVINPRTAHSPTQSVSVSVTAPTVMQADALSTSAFVMPPKDGVHFVDAQPGSDCLIVGKSGANVTTRRWSRLSRT